MLMACENALALHKNGAWESIYQDLLDYDMYHLLLKGSKASVLRLVNQYGSLPTEYLDWYQCCSGGLLFDTEMCSMQDHDVEVDFRPETFAECNKPDGSDFPFAEYLVFAKTVTGDLLCFKRTSNREYEQTIYQWDQENQSFEFEWTSFYEWMRECIDDAILSISEDELEPIPMKLED